MSCFYCSFQQRTTKDWAQAFDGSGIPCGPINNIKQVFEDPQVNELKTNSQKKMLLCSSVKHILMLDICFQVKHKQMVQELDHPTAGRIRVPGYQANCSSGLNPSACVSCFMLVSEKWWKKNYFSNVEGYRRRLHTEWAQKSWEGDLWRDIAAYSLILIIYFISFNLLSSSDNPASVFLYATFRAVPPLVILSATSANSIP